MKKVLLFLLTVFLLTNVAFASEVKDEMYYKRQIQNQRYPYSNAGIITAIKRGKYDIVELYMNAGFDANSSYGGTPLIFFAIYTQQAKCLDVLLEAGANPETTIPPMYVSCHSETALTYAIKRKNSDMVKSLIQYKVDVNRNYKGQKPLRLAVAKKQTKIVETLLKAGATPDEKTIKMVQKSKDVYLEDLFDSYLN